MYKQEMEIQSPLISLIFLKLTQVAYSFDSEMRYKLIKRKCVEIESIILWIMLYIDNLSVISKPVTN